MVDYVRYWNEKAETPAKQILRWMKVPEGTFYKWRERYGKVNEHNGWIPRDHWLQPWEKDAIIKFRLANLSPRLIAAYDRQRTRKGRNDLQAALRHFNDRENVVEFGRRAGLGAAFFRPPTYIHDWEKNKEGWI